MELELGKCMEANGSGMRELAQLAVRRYATALEVILRTLAENALRDAEHNEVRAEQDGTLLATDSKILDPLAAKQWAITLTTEVAVFIPSVNSIIVSKPTGGPKVPQQASNWNED
ncbi:hypothetical protein F4604DRAFT_1916078 [Suillus subluteus]|nr:hypothetical protein F4604DRAFT_1916078 [Suillus subluteus]